MLLKVICQLLYSYFINNGTHLRITELALCLSFKFAFGELYGDDRIYSLSYSFTAQRNKLLDLVLLLLGLLIVISLLFLILLYKVVYYLVQCIFECNLVRTAVNRMNIVCKRSERFTVEVCVVLKCNLNGYIIKKSLNIYNIGMKRFCSSFLLQPFYIADNTALILKDLLLRLVLISEVT